MIHSDWLTEVKMSATIGSQRFESVPRAIRFPDPRSGREHLSWIGSFWLKDAAAREVFRECLDWVVSHPNAVPAWTVDALEEGVDLLQPTAAVRTRCAKRCARWYIHFAYREKKDRAMDATWHQALEGISDGDGCAIRFVGHTTWIDGRRPMVPPIVAPLVRRYPIRPRSGTSYDGARVNAVTSSDQLHHVLTDEVDGPNRMYPVVLLGAGNQIPDAYWCWDSDGSAGTSGLVVVRLETKQLAEECAELLLHRELRSKTRISGEGLHLGTLFIGRDRILDRWGLKDGRIFEDSSAVRERVVELLAREDERWPRLLEEVECDAPPSCLNTEAREATRAMVLRGEMARFKVDGTVREDVWAVGTDIDLEAIFHGYSTKRRYRNGRKERKEAFDALGLLSRPEFDVGMAKGQRVPVYLLDRRAVAELQFANGLWPRDAGIPISVRAVRG